MVIVGVDPDPANAATIRQWTRDYRKAVHPFNLAGAYPPRRGRTWRKALRIAAAVPEQHDPGAGGDGMLRRSGTVSRHARRIMRVGLWPKSISRRRWLALDERMDAQPWLAHTRHEFAMVLRRRDKPADRTRAGKLLTAAAETGEWLGMRALLKTSTCSAPLGNINIHPYYQ